MQLRDYQIEDVERLKTLDCAGIFNEQRTGKTPTTLVALQEKGCRKILIVAPTSMTYKWKEEFETWLNRPCIVIEGTEKKRHKLLSLWTDGAVISYGLLKDTERYSGLISDISNIKIDAVVLDEAHRIKNTASANARACAKLTKIPVRYALTGTPAPNRAYEIYTILYWLRPKEFNSYWSFINHYFNVVNIDNGYGNIYKDIRGFKRGKQQELLNKINDFCIQRKRAEVMPWLPQKDYNKINLEPTAKQKKHLTELANYFETGDVVTQGILDRLVRYRQICLAPQLLGFNENSPKLNWITQYIKDYPDKPKIIFSKFTSFLEILYDKIKNNQTAMIIGETNPKQRAQYVKDFQEGKLNTLLIQIDTGKEGLTLDRAEVEIFMDKYPPVGDIQQAEDRFIATTEDKANKPHEIIEVILKDTYDEQLYKLIESRVSEVDVINDFKKYLGGN